MRSILALCLLCLATSAWAHQAKVLRVIDGDTLFVALPEMEVATIRLYGIDCPEGRQEAGEEAAAFVRQLAEGKTFTVQDLGKDRYGRTVAVLYFPDGSVIQKAIAAAGYAWIAPRYCKRPECLVWKALEKRALKEKRGLWRYPRPLPPWQWRKR